MATDEELLAELMSDDGLVPHSHVPRSTPRVDPETAAERVSVCEKCDQLDLADYTCAQCSCSVLTRARMDGMTCPLDKWAK